MFKDESDAIFYDEELIHHSMCVTPASYNFDDYRSLIIGDQIALLKGATFEVMQIRFNMVFNAKRGIWECGHIIYCIDDAVRGKITYKSQSKLL